MIAEAKEDKSLVDATPALILVPLRLNDTVPDSESVFKVAELVAVANTPMLLLAVLMADAMVSAPVPAAQLTPLTVAKPPTVIDKLVS